VTGAAWRPEPGSRIVLGETGQTGHVIASRALPGGALIVTLRLDESVDGKSIVDVPITRVE